MHAYQIQQKLNRVCPAVLGGEHEGRAAFWGVKPVYMEQIRQLSSNAGAAASAGATTAGFGAARQAHRPLAAAAAACRRGGWGAGRPGLQ